MTAAAVAALTVYDMVKGVERGVAIEEVVLLEKSGGRSGDWRPARTGQLSAGGAPDGQHVEGAGEGADESGPRLAALAAGLGLEVAGREILPDDQARSRRAAPLGRRARLSR